MLWKKAWASCIEDVPSAITHTDSRQFFPVRVNPIFSTVCRTGGLKYVYVSKR